ncbi:MAG: extracellular solute-binding protein [Crenarchaeota archaeon]|nr:extracellular solute-binding protein [Thermoproteota archaeon]
MKYYRALSKTAGIVIAIIIIIGIAAGAYYYIQSQKTTTGKLITFVPLTGDFHKDIINVGKALEQDGVKTVQFSVWSGGDPNSVMRIYGIVEAAYRINNIWKQNNINVEIKVSTRYVSNPNDVYEDYINKWSLGQAPDIMANGYTYIASLASEGYILDLTPYLNNYTSFLNQFYPTLIEAMKWKGKIYGIPQDTEARPLYIRKDVAACAGLDLSGLAEKIKNGQFTWSDLYKWALKVKESGCAPWGLIHRKGSAHPDLIQFIYAFGGKLYDEKTGKLVFDKAAVYKWFTVEKTFADHGLLPHDMMSWDWAKQIHPTVVDGKTLAFIGGTWHWFEWQTKAYYTDPKTGQQRPLTAEEVHKFFYYTLFPSGIKGKHGLTLSQPFAWMINSKAGEQNPNYDKLKDLYHELAFLVVVKASDPDIIAIHSLISGHLPVTKTAAELIKNKTWVEELKSLKIKLDPVVLNNIKGIIEKTVNPINVQFLANVTYMLEYTTFTPKHPQYPKLASLFAEALDQVLRDKMTPAQAVNFIVEKIKADPDLEKSVEIVGEIPQNWTFP